MIFDDRALDLGEGPIWHPERGQFFWFDIRSGHLLSRDKTGPLMWEIGENASVAGWVDRDTFLIGTETRLLTLNLTTGAQTDIAPLEADNPITRSNDGRADPFGGLWIGTMGKTMLPNAGAFYRYYRGEIRKLYDGITVPNACCFAANGDFAHFADTTAKIVMRVALDSHGWPKGNPEPWLDLRAEGLLPDGAVLDADGNFWCALYKSGRVAAYDKNANFVRSLDFPASQTTCPAFGGPDLTTLYCTSATQKLPPEDLAANPDHGRTFALHDVARGLPETKVIL